MSARAADVKSNRGCGCKGSGNAGGCGCGGGCSGGCTANCAPQGECASQCCELECLVRPNFFCGQLLTDADLAAMIQWTRKRFALSRYKDGWGIVCGLDLTCSPQGVTSACCGDGQESKGPFVWLNQGYAIDCCGNDLVVCDPLRIDLASICRPPDDPCDPLTRRNPAGQASTQPARDRGDVVDPCFIADTKNLFAVQVSLRYHEDLAQGQRAMFRSGGACADNAACEYARVLERPCVHLECVPMPPEQDDDPDEFEMWKEQLAKGVKQIAIEVVAAVRVGPEGVLKYLRAHPPYQACYLKELVCCLRDSDTKLSEESMSQLGHLLLLDRIVGELGTCNCFDCRPDTGVPLGVVIMRRSTTAGRTTCTVYKIDPRERYRRYLRKELCQRVRDGIDLIRLLGQPVGVVRSQLKTAGVQVEGAASRLRSLDELANIASSHVFSIDPASGLSLRPQVIVDPVGTERVFGFVPG